MKRAIITGATGMIGIALINRLLKEDIEITAVVRPNSKRAGRIPKNSKIKIHMAKGGGFAIKLHRIVT